MRVVLDYDNVRHKGILTSEIFPAIREYFSVENPNARFGKRFYVGYRPPSRTYALTPQGRFEPRLTWEIIDYVKKEYPLATIEFTDSLKKIIDPPPLGNVEIAKLGLELRDYQEGSILEAIQRRCGVIVLPTSAGKTLVMATLTQTIRSVFDTSFRCLILVPDIQLVRQSYGDFVEYGIPKNEITAWTGNDEPDPSARIIIANSQILLSKKQDLELLKYVNLLIVDEAHKIRHGNQINKVLKKIPAKFRFGFTGTLPDEKMDRWNIIGQLGPLIYERKSIDLREQKHITDVKVARLLLHYHNPPLFSRGTMANPTEGFEEEILFLQDNGFRNKVLKNIIEKITNNCLVLVDRIAHGELLYEYLSSLTGKEVFFIRGSMELDERESIRKIMENNHNVVCIAISKIFSTGVNIKNLHYVFFAAIGKSKIKLIQSIGRSLRQHESKKEAMIFDLCDQLYYGIKHSEERSKIYKEEQIQITNRDVYERNHSS